MELRIFDLNGGFLRKKRVLNDQNFPFFLYLYQNPEKILWIVELLFCVSFPQLIQAECLYKQ